MIRLYCDTIVLSLILYSELLACSQGHYLVQDLTKVSRTFLILINPYEPLRFLRSLQNPALIIQGLSSRLYPQCSDICVHTCIEMSAKLCAFIYIQLCCARSSYWQLSVQSGVLACSTFLTCEYFIRGLPNALRFLIDILFKCFILIFPYLYSI